MSIMKAMLRSIRGLDNLRSTDSGVELDQSICQIPSVKLSREEIIDIIYRDLMREGITLHSVSRMMDKWSPVWSKANAPATTHRRSETPPRNTSALHPKGTSSSTMSSIQQQIHLQELQIQQTALMNTLAASDTSEIQPPRSSSSPVCDDRSSRSFDYSYDSSGHSSSSSSHSSSDHGSSYSSCDSGSSGGWD